MILAMDLWVKLDNFWKKYFLFVFRGYTCLFKNEAFASFASIALRPWHVDGFLRVLRFPPPIKLTTDISDILLKVKHRNPNPLEDCSEFGNFVITLIYLLCIIYIYSTKSIFDIILNLHFALLKLSRCSDFLHQ